VPSYYFPSATKMVLWHITPYLLNQDANDIGLGGKISRPVSFNLMESWVLFAQNLGFTLMSF
jgi:hypothetical protein